MTDPSSGGATLRTAPAMLNSAPVPQRGLDRNVLLHGIAAHRRRLAELETSMVEACERAAVRGACRKVRMHDHHTWDKATWHRYLEAVARLEPDYMPQMRRVLRDIHRFERLLTLPIASAPAA
jgi:hypothetical protein